MLGRLKCQLQDSWEVLLHWKEQINWVSRQIHKSDGIIKRFTHLVTTNCVLTLHYTLIYPYLIVWASTFLMNPQNVGPFPTWQKALLL